MECPNCGWIEVEALTFCPQCGSQLIESAPPAGGRAQTRWIHEPGAERMQTTAKEDTWRMETAMPALTEDVRESVQDTDEEVIEVVVVEETPEEREEATQLDLPLPEAPTSSTDTPEPTLTETSTQEGIQAELIYEGEGGPARFSFRGEVLIGRTSPESGPVDIDLSGLPNAQYVSRRHARIFFQDGMYWVEDLGSTNGVFVNQGPRILKPTPLKPGDRIAFATLTFVFQLVEA